MVQEINFSGSYLWRLSDKYGKLKEEGIINNTVIRTGIAEITGLILSDVGGTAYGYIAVGTDNTAPASTDTTLGTEITDSGLSRAVGTGTQQTTTFTNDTSQLSTTYTITGTKQIREVGVFNASSGGSMLSRALFTRDVVSGDTLEIIFKLTIT